MKFKIVMWMLTILLLCSFASATITWGVDDNIYIPLADYNESTGLVNLGSSGSSYDGVAIGGIGFSADNTSFDFDGSDDTVSIETSETYDLFGSAGSLSFWFNADSDPDTTTGQRLLFQNYALCEFENNFQCRIYDQGASTFRDLTYTSGLSASTWYHVVVTWNTNDLVLYIDGSSVATSSSFTLQEGLYSFYIGSGNNVNKYYDGELSDFIHFSKELSSTEVSTLYGEGRNYNPYATTTTNFSVSVVNYWNSSDVNNVSVEVNGITYTNTTGNTITTNISFDNLNNWTENRPSGDNDYNWSTLETSSNGKYIIAGIFGSRLYLSNDSGSSWTETRPKGDVNGNWSTVSITSNGQKMFAGEYSGRLYYSNDYGNTWTETRPHDNNDYFWRGVNTNDDGSIVIIAENYNLYLSTNSGTTWTNIKPANNIDWTDTTIDSDGSHIMAVADSFIYKTINSGSTWTNSTFTVEWETISTNNDGSKVIGASYFGRAYITSNFGSSWTETTPNGFVDLSYEEVSMDDSGENIIIGTYYDGLYYSNDGGSSWIETQPDGKASEYWTIATISKNGNNMYAGAYGDRLYQTITYGLFDIIINSDNYFQRTYTDYNISSNLEAELYQSIISFESKEKFTENIISDCNYTIDTIQNTTFYLNEGEYTVLTECPSYYPLNYTFNVTALDNKTITITGLYDNIINLTITDQNGGVVNSTWSNVILGSGDIIDGEAIIPSLQGNNYSITIGGDEYFEEIVYANTSNNYTLIEETLFNQNTIIINFRDFDSRDLITDEVNYTINSDSITYDGTTSSGSINLSVISESYIITAESSGYETSYSVVVVPSSPTEQNISMYMVESIGLTSITFNVIDTFDDEVQEALITISKIINGTSYIISQKLTDFTGSASFNLDQTIEYVVIVTKEDYETFTGKIIPTNTEYTLRIDDSAAIIKESIFENIYFDTSYNYDNLTINFSLLVTSSDSSLDSYELSTYYNSVEYSNYIIDSPSGGIVGLSINYDPEIQTEFTVNYEFIVNGDSYSWNETYIVVVIDQYDIDFSDMNTKSKLVIGIIITLVLISIGMILGGSTGGLLGGIVAMGVITATKIISIPAGIIGLTIIILIIVMINKGERL